MLFKEYSRLLTFFINVFFSQHIVMVSVSLEEENITKDIRILFRLKKEKNYTVIKGAEAT